MKRAYNLYEILYGKSPFDGMTFAEKEVLLLGSNVTFNLKTGELFRDGILLSTGLSIDPKTIRNQVY
jgi:hypothetical protein